MSKTNSLLSIIMKGAHWTVDLGEEHQIARVEVFNRRDCCGERLSDSVVQLLHGDDIVATYGIAAAETAQKFTIPAHLFSGQSEDTFEDNQDAPFEDNQELKAAVVACASPSNQGSTACQNFMSKYGWPMNSWEVGRITDMSDLFTPREIPRDFNEDISSWDVSSVTDMHGMFSGQYVFNKDISEWDVSRVTNMRSMFRNARKFNQVRRLIV